MNRFFNEGVSSSVSRVSGLSGSVGQKCRQSCDIAKSVPPTASKRSHNETAIKISFNGIFESNPRSEGSVASDRSESPVVSPMVALNHSRQSPTPVDTDSLTDNHQMDDIKGNSKRGRKRKVKEVFDPLIEKFEARSRVHKSKTTEELAQKFNIEVKESSDFDNNRIVTTIRTNKRHNKNVSNVEIDDNETQSKTELMERFLSSQSSNTCPTIQEDNDYNYNSHSLDFGDRPVTSPQSVSHFSGHYTHPSVSSYHPKSLPNSSFASYHQKTVSSDSVGEEINNILSHLPPLYVNEIVWSDSEPNDDKSSDNELISVPNDDNNRDHNHKRDQQNSDLDSDNSNSDNNVLNLIQNEIQKSKTVTEYEVEKYCEQKWESVNGTYDAETEWRPWNSLTSSVSYNGDILHILPYVDIDLRTDQNSDSE